MRILSPNPLIAHKCLIISVPFFRLSVLVVCNSTKQCGQLLDYPLTGMDGVLQTFSTVIVHGQSLNSSSTYLQPATWVSISIWKFGHFFLPPKVINFSENSSKVGQHPVICKGFLSYVNGQKSFIIRPSITNPISYIFIEKNKKRQISD